MTESSEPIRVSMVVGIGLIGSDEDIARFAQIMTNDFEKRAHKCNERLFGGRLQILPMAEDEDEVSESAGSPS